MPEGVQFRQELSIREAACKAFAMVDNDQTLRRAIVHRSRPHRGLYEKGEWVMMWKQGGETEGSWIGPMQVIIQEDQNVVWVSRSHKLYRIAPEHLRGLSEFEEFRQNMSPEEVNSFQGSVMPGVQFADMMLPSPAARQQNEMTNRAAIPDVPETEGIASDQNNQVVNSRTSSENLVRSNASDQPDREPEVPSIPSSQADESPPNMEATEPNHIDIPIPETSDESASDPKKQDSMLNLNRSTILEVNKLLVWK